MTHIMDHKDGPFPSTPTSIAARGIGEDDGER